MICIGTSFIYIVFDTLQKFKWSKIYWYINLEINIPVKFSPRLPCFAHCYTQILTFLVSIYSHRSTVADQTPVWSSALSVRRHFHLAVFMFKVVNGIIVSIHLAHLFEPLTLRHDVHDRDDMVVPQTRTVTGSKAISGCGFVCWNTIPENVSSADTVDTFKNRYWRFYSWFNMPASVHDLSIYDGMLNWTRFCHICKLPWYFMSMMTSTSTEFKRSNSSILQFINK